MRLSAAEKKKLEERAAKVLVACGYENGEDGYVDAVRLARFFGFYVLESSKLPATENGCITVSTDNGETDKCIIVNEARSFETKRFTIAHELAHYFLYFTGESAFFKHRENYMSKADEESDADYLAACLLMPRKCFKNQYAVLKKGRTRFGAALELQRVFHVPIESIERRIEAVCRT